MCDRKDISVLQNFHFQHLAILHQVGTVFRSRSITSIEETSLLLIYIYISLVNSGFAILGKSFYKLFLDAMIDIIIPTVDPFCPLLYNVFLRLSSLALCLEAEFS